MPNLITYEEYHKLRKQKTAKDIYLEKGSQCPTAYASILENTKILNDSEICYKGDIFSKQMFEEKPSFSYWSEITNLHRSTVRYLGIILGVKIKKSTSCKFNNRRKKPILTKHQLSLLYGSLLGDGFITPNGQFGIYQCQKHSGYIDWFYGQVVNICPSQPKVCSSILKGKKFYGRRLTTYVTDEIELLKEKFYPQKIKVIPEDLSDNLTPLSLAAWYMEDGGTHWYKTNSGFRAIARIYSLNFNYREHQILSEVLKSKWGINCNISPHKAGNKWFLKFDRDNSELLFDIIRPIVCKNFKYKVEKNGQSTTKG